ncbi:MAG: PilN domain-containing protein [Gammaproteobacteria bacterium]|nr:PilN domain-containing protein [Gammaproteobacteria bacterium]
MPHINLLPWREELRKEREKRFYIGIGASVFFGALLVGLAHFYMDTQIQHQRGRNAMLQQEITQIEGKIQEINELEKKREALISRMEIIERLQAERPQAVHLFDEMVQMVPDGLILNGLNVTGEKISIQGQAESNARVSAFMRAIESSPWFENPNLEVIQAQGERSRTFSLTTKQIKQKAE